MSQDPLARQETGLPAMPGLASILQLAGASLSWQGRGRGSHPSPALSAQSELPAMCHACRDSGQHFSSRLETSARSHQPGDVVAMAVGDGGGDGGQAAPLLTEPPSGQAVPLVSETDLVSQTVWQVLMGCFACTAAVGNTLTQVT